MKTLYAACLNRLGLSQSGAAELHGVRIDTVKKWSVGSNPTPPGVWADLRQYESSIIDRSEAIRESWEDAGESREIVAKCADDLALMGLADFVLGNDATPAINVRLIADA